MKKISNSRSTAAKITKTNKGSALGNKSTHNKSIKPTTVGANGTLLRRVNPTKIEWCLALLTTPDGVRHYRVVQANV